MQKSSCSAILGMDLASVVGSHISHKTEKLKMYHNDIEGLNVKKIISVLKAEAEGLITGTMVREDDCGHIGHCAIGALLAASGITDHRLENWGALEIWIPVLQFDYGLTPSQSLKLMNYNDDCAGPSRLSDKGRQDRLNRVDTVVEFVWDMAAS